MAANSLPGPQVPRDAHCVKEQQKRAGSHPRAHGWPALALRGDAACGLGDSVPAAGFLPPANTSLLSLSL